jgi:hypothetical protein
MKSNKRAGALLLAAFSLMYSCRKDDSKQEYGFSKIYMPQAVILDGGVTATYAIPSGTDSSTYNYITDRTAGKVNVILGASLSGPGQDAYSVDIQVNNDTIQKMFTAKVLDTAVYKLMPASMYSLPASLDVPQGAKRGTFLLSLDIAQLKQTIYTGKYLVLAVKLANSSKGGNNYEINKSISTTIVTVDVNTLVIGPAVNVTNTYLRNPGAPFIANGFMSGSTRWGNLRDWTANAAAKSHGGFGGYNSDGGGTMDMECGWGSPQILNGKIYQTVVSLPAGSYTFDLSGGNWSGGENFMKDIGYMVVAPNMDSLPDYSAIVGNANIYYQSFAKPTQPVINFKLATAAKVTVGTVINFVQTEQGFKTKQVVLNNYPKAL